MRWMLFLVFLFPVAAQAQDCDRSHDPTVRNLVSLASTLEAAGNFSTATMEQSNASLAWRLLQRQHIDQLGTIDEGDVQVASQIPQAETPDIWRIMPAASVKNLADLSAVTHPAQLPKRGKPEAMFAAGFKEARNANGWVVGDPWPGGQGQLVVFSTGSPVARIVSYDGNTVTYTTLGLYETNFETRETRWEVKDRVVIELPDGVPGPSGGF